MISTSVTRVICTYRRTTGLLGSSFLFHQVGRRGRRGRIRGSVRLPLCPFKWEVTALKHDRAAVQRKGTDRGTGRGDRQGNREGTDRGTDRETDRGQTGGQTAETDRGQAVDTQRDRQWAHWPLTAVSSPQPVQTASPSLVSRGLPRLHLVTMCRRSTAPVSFLCALSLISCKVFSVQHKCCACLQVLSVDRMRKSTEM